MGEARVAEFMKSHNESSKSVLNRMSQGSESALIQQCFQGWVEVYQEMKKAAEMEDLMYQNSAKFGSFASRNKASAGGAMDRAAQAQDDNTMIVIFWYWKRETRVERMKRYAKDKNNKKKQQLVGVKGLFKNSPTSWRQGSRREHPA